MYVQIVKNWPVGAHSFSLLSPFGTSPNIFQIILSLHYDNIKILQDHLDFSTYQDIYGKNYSLRIPDFFFLVENRVKDKICVWAYVWMLVLDKILCFWENSMMELLKKKSLLGHHVHWYLFLNILSSWYNMQCIPSPCLHYFIKVFKTLIF